MPLDNLVAGRAGGAPAIKAMIECRRAWAPHSQPCDGTGGGPGRRHPGIQRQFLFGTVVGFPWSGSQKESRSVRLVRNYVIWPPHVDGAEPH